MKSTKILAASAFLALFASAGASALDEYICHSESMTGFRKEYGSWKPTFFTNQLVVTVKEFGNSGSYTIDSEPALFSGGTVDDGWKNSKSMIVASTAFFCI